MASKPIVSVIHNGLGLTFCCWGDRAGRVVLSPFRLDGNGDAMYLPLNVVGNNARLME